MEEKEEEGGEREEEGEGTQPCKIQKRRQQRCIGGNWWAPVTSPERVLALRGLAERLTMQTDNCETTYVNRILSCKI